MIDLEQLQAGGGRLSATLEQYAAVCTSVVDTFDPKNMTRGFSGTIERELELISSFEITLGLVKAALTRVKNLIPANAPINQLPFDILTRIFHLVHEAQPYYFENHKFLSSVSPRYPEALSHVSSHWRQVALSSHALWSRLDVVPFHDAEYYLPLITRATVFAARAKPVPLELHIVSSESVTRFQPPNLEVVRDALFDTIAPRVRSLTFSPRENFDISHLSVLQTFFEKCTPGTLQELVIEPKNDLWNVNWVEAPRGPRKTVWGLTHGMCTWRTACLRS